MQTFAELSATAANENGDTTAFLFQTASRTHAGKNSLGQPPSAKKRALGDATSRLNAESSPSTWGVTPQKRGRVPVVPFGLFPGLDGAASATPRASRQEDADWEVRELNNQIEARPTAASPLRLCIRPSTGLVETGAGQHTPGKTCWGQRQRLRESLRAISKRPALSLLHASRVCGRSWRHERRRSASQRRPSPFRPPRTRGPRRRRASMRE